MTDGRFYPVDVFQLQAYASNIRPTDNPAYTKDDFLTVFPQFTDNVPDEVLENFILMASANINEQRWFSSWSYATALFVAHFLTLYVRACGTTSAPKTSLDNSMRGVLTSKSVDGLSMSFDVSSILSDLNGWGAYKLTEYGVQLVSMANLIPTAGMYVS